MAKCPKHLWFNIKIRHIVELNLEAGGLNYLIPDMRIEVCVRCHKVRNFKNEQNPS